MSPKKQLPKKKTAPKKKAVQKEPQKKSRSCCLSCFLTFTAISALSIILISGALYLFFKDSLPSSGYKELISKKFSKQLFISALNLKIERGTLTAPKTKAAVFLKVANNLPFEVVLERIEFSLKSGDDYYAAKDLFAIIQKEYSSNQSGEIAALFELDSILARRALAKDSKGSALNFEGKAYFSFKLMGLNFLKQTTVINFAENPALTPDFVEKLH